jgi:hypothetical protein
MERFGLLALLVAKPGNEQEVSEFLKSARPVVLEEVVCPVRTRIKSRSATEGETVRFRESPHRTPIRTALPARKSSMRKSCA